jgi:hypothetical protein
MKVEQSVPKRRNINFRRRGITQKKTHNIQNKAKVWNKNYSFISSTGHIHENQSQYYIIIIIIVVVVVWNMLYITMYATHLAHKQGGCLTLSRFEHHSTWPNTGVCTMFSRGSYFLNRLQFLWQKDTVFTFPSEYVTLTIISQIEVYLRVSGNCAGNFQCRSLLHLRVPSSLPLDNL